MQRVALLQHLEYLQAGTDNGGSYRVAEQVGAAALTQQVDDLLTARGETTHGTTEGLTQRTGVDIYTTVGLVQLAHTMTRSAYYTGRV